MRVTYEDAHAAIVERLSESAVGHSERVAEMCGEIAAVYGVDTSDARLAGLVHDWHRETDTVELLERARRASIEIGPVDESVPYLLHGPVAASELAEQWTSIGSDVVEAVGAHTYGAAEMSPLAKVVYIGDVLEPGRRHAHAAELRSLVGEVSLDELFARTYAASLAHLVRSRKRMHPMTLEVYNRFVAGTRP
jgi:predicted HD superfamily hydrolase involved in NAD metabolism